VEAAVLQHVWCETPGYFEDLLIRKGYHVTVVELDDGESLPDPTEIDLALVLGGPMSVNDEASFPFLAEEKEWIAAVVNAGRGFFGVCLGAQLLSASLGGAVTPGSRPEVGVLPVSLTDAGRLDPVLGELGETFDVLQWHGDTFEVPSGATLLAGSAAFAHQAFSYGSSAYGVQFHLEVTREMVESWATIPEYVDYLDTALGQGGYETLLEDFDRHSPALEQRATLMFSRFLDQVAQKRVESAEWSS
jgi:GMP synthase (glutamine-hydrolysing)